WSREHRAPLGGVRQSGEQWRIEKRRADEDSARFRRERPRRRGVESDRMEGHRDDAWWRREPDVLQLACDRTDGLALFRLDRLDREIREPVEELRELIE